jgi:uncharacterized membrane protein YraQ (UPF0718 family)
VKQKKEAKKSIPLILFSLITIGYIVLYFVNEIVFRRALEKFMALTFQIAPILLLIFILMFINFWFIKPEKVKKYLGKSSGFKGYSFAILSGIISVGSVYMWYPLLKELKKSGMSNKLIAIFIYNRSIKLHLLPLMILYFGINFALILMVLTILFSILLGYFVQKFDLNNDDD